VKVRLKKVIESPLLTVQKNGAVKTILLTLDFMVLNDHVGENQLVMGDKHTRGVIDEAVKVGKLRVECSVLPRSMDDCRIRVWLIDGEFQ
jgi:hypothetical protein